MNIFYLDTEPKAAAESHCNKHVVKMILESAQMLCTAHWLSMPAFKQGTTAGGRPKTVIERIRGTVPANKLPPWGVTHVNHPSAVWTRSSTSHYVWHSKLGLELCAEYTRRYARRHKSEDVHLWLSQNLPLITDLGFVEPPTCMPDDVKVQGNAVASYRNYYVKYKSRMAVWEPRAKVPHWYSQEINSVKMSALSI